MGSWMHVSRQLRVYQARYAESRKMTVYWIRRSLYEQSMCRGSTIKTRNRVWEVVRKKSTAAMRAKTYAKCNMMQCVLNGTPLKSSKCHGKLPLIKKKILTKKTEKTVCKKLKPPSMHIRIRRKPIRLHITRRI